jgi:hypothetical protein
LDVKSAAFKPWYFHGSYLFAVAMMAPLLILTIRTSPKKITELCFRLIAIPFKKLSSKIFEVGFAIHTQVLSFKSEEYTGTDVTSSACFNDMHTSNAS